jgi:hypothetical protein
MTSAFLKHMDWDADAQGVTLNWDNKNLWAVKRPDTALLVQQLDFVRDYADQRGDRGIEITSQMGSLGDYYGFILGLTGSHNPRTLEQIYITHKMAGHAVKIPKHNLACRRPDQLDGRVMPMIPTPGHGTFPSGHATEAFAIATVLSALVRANPKQFPDADARVAMTMKQAERIAVNRTVAGVHYPIDSYAGATLGTMIGRTIVALGNQ